MKLSLLFLVILLLVSVISADTCPAPQCSSENCDLVVTQTKHDKLSVDWSFSFWDLDLECVQDMIISLNGEKVKQL